MTAAEALAQLDLRAPLTGRADARRRVAEMRKRRAEHDRVFRRVVPARVRQRTGRIR